MSVQGHKFALKFAAILLLVTGHFCGHAEAAPAFVSSAQTSGPHVGGPTVTATAPPGYVAGDLLVCGTSLDDSVAFASPAGWTTVYSDPITNGDVQAGSIIYTIATGTDSFAFSTTGDGENSGYSIVCAAYSGVPSSGELDVSSNNNPNSTTIPVMPITVTGTSVTTTGADLVIFFGLIDQDDAGTWTWTTPPGFTTRQTTPGGSSASTSTFADMIQSSAGATGTITSTATSSENGEGGNFIGFTLAFKPAATTLNSAWSKAGAIVTPVPGTTQVWLKNGSFGTIDGSTVEYWQPKKGNFGVN